MLKPLVKGGLFLALKRGFLPPKMRTLDIFGNYTPRNELTTKTRFWVHRAPSQSLPGKLEVPSGNQKRKKHAWVEHFTAPPNDPPLCTLLVLCMWGGVTDIITHAKFHLNRFSSFGSPGGRNSPFPIGLENALTTVLRTNVLRCDGELCFVRATLAGYDDDSRSFAL